MMEIQIWVFVILCIFGFIGFIAAMWFVYIIGFEIGEIIGNYKFYKEYYLESQKERALKIMREQQEQQDEVEEDE